jgi:CubicO group peptidase (beta-lactamase class C family)
MNRIRVPLKIMIKLLAGMALMAMTANASTSDAANNDHVAHGILLTTAQMDASVRDLMKQARVPGLAIAIIQDGQIVRSQAHGMADVANHQLMAPNTVMYAASLTKPAFAYMTMQLVDEGIIDLDAPLPKLLKKPLPDYPDYVDLAGDPRWKAITPRMLLSHSSGLLNWRRFNDDGKLDIKYAPGTRYVYSGEGMQLLQLIDEERTGKSLTELMQTRVFDRLGMQRTSMIWRADFAGSASNGYNTDGVSVGHEQHTKPMAAASMDTTVEDYARFVAAVMRGDGLSKKSAREMMRAQIRIVSPQEFPSHFPGKTRVNDAIKLSAGLGWVLYESPLGPAMFKEGNDEGTNNFVLAFPESQMAVVMLSNSARADRMFYPLVEALYGRTCLPWFWMGYIPYDKSELRNPKAREHPIAACPH